MGTTLAGSELDELGIIEPLGTSMNGVANILASQTPSLSTPVDRLRLL